MNNINIENISNYREIESDDSAQENSSLVIGGALAAIAGVVTTTIYAGYSWYTRIMVDKLNKNLDKWCDEVKGAEEYENRCEAKEKIIECYKKSSDSVYLGGLGLTSLPSEIGWLSSVRILYLHKNQLRELPTTIGQLRYLEDLIVRDNELQELPATIGQLQALKFLDVRRNKFRELPAIIGQLQTLKFLNLDRNQLQTLPKEIGELRNLESLSINDNKLQALPPEIGNCRNLRRFYISSNELRELPATIGQLQDLKQLEIDRNQLQSLPTEMGQLRKLHHLDLGLNEISFLANLIENYPERSLFSPGVIVELGGNPIVNDEEAYSAFRALLNRSEELEVDLYEGGPPVEIHFEDFSNNPTQVLIHLSEAMTENGFPRIEHINSPGQDVGGLTRDCITRLFSVLFDSKTPRLPMKSKTGKEQYTPMILPEAKLSLKEQILCYQAIGKIFALTIVGYKSISTGPYFEPIVFAMIHSLSEEDLSALPNDIDITNVKELPKEIFEKLFALYAEKVLGMKSATIGNMLNDRFQEDEDLQLACLESMEDVFALSQIDKIIPAILVIAKSMYDYRKVLDREGSRKIAPWDRWKRSSADVLRVRIEGKLEKKDLFTALEWRGEGSSSDSRGDLWVQLKRWILGIKPCHEKTREFLEQWIQKASDEKLRKFLWALSGKSTLFQDRKLVITLEKKGSLPVFHSCFGSMDLSCEYESYEAFEKAFHFAIEEALAQGFSLA